MNKNYNILHIILLLIFIYSVFIYSCKKQNDDNEPIVNVESPLENVNVSATDSILIKLNISDDYGPLTVRVYIADEQMKAVTTVKEFNTDKNILNINDYYLFSNKYLTTGNYYLTFNVNDGKNTVNNFIKIHINEIPLKLNSIYVGIRDGSGTRVFKSDSLMNFIEIGYVPFFITSASINNYSEQIYFLSNTGELFCYSLGNFQLEWSKNSYFLQNHIKLGEIKYNSYLSYVTDGLGFVYGYDSNGQIRQIYSMDNSIPYSFNFIDNYLFCCAEDKNTFKKSIQTYSLAGGILTKYTTNFMPLKILPYANKTTLIIAQNQSNVELYTYNYEINYLYSFGSVYGGLYNDAVTTPDNKFIVSVGNKLNIIEKTYGITTEFAPGKKADLLKFETISGLLYTADSNNVTIYNYPLQSIYFTYNFNDKITFIEYYYNK